ncbi:TPA: hypothetical protein ACPY0B_002752 [Citrobacter farmeri]|uniref:hypothetical protein n=1 Tax=Citrobacter braakii TaxID=57706 RepID=UPI000CDE0950|nr:hypothetical protein [Citrobacter braakii]POT61332.1 hypothetical protein C3428_19140 [Citrobacter braakii]HBH7007823.1 hypothetical protein [Citrobacter freundii]
MKKKILLSALLISALTPAVSQAFGNRDTWASGWGQGVSEFVILGKGQSQLYLTCEDTGSRAATLRFTDEKGHQVRMDSGQSLNLKIDDETPVSISDSESHVGSDNVAWAWNQLRTGKRVIVSGEGVKAAVFTLNGAGKVLPAFGDSGCLPKYALP